MAEFYDQAVAEQTAAREELDRVRTKVIEEVTAARAAAEEHRREVKYRAALAEHDDLCIVEAIAERLRHRARHR